MGMMAANGVFRNPLPHYAYAFLRTVRMKRSDAISHAEQHFDSGEFQHTLAQRVAVPTESQIVHQVGEPLYRPVVNAAIENRSDLIVVGTHGRSGLKRFLLGSVAEGVMRHSPIPVLAVPWLPSAGH